MDAKIGQCTTIFSEILSIPAMGNTSSAFFWFTVGVWLQVQIVDMLCGTPDKDACQETV
jgi:hypothetical protein